MKNLIVVSLQVGLVFSAFLAAARADIRGPRLVCTNAQIKSPIIIPAPGSGIIRGTFADANGLHVLRAAGPVYETVMGNILGIHTEQRGLFIDLSGSQPNELDGVLSIVPDEGTPRFAGPAFGGRVHCQVR